MSWKRFLEGFPGHGDDILIYDGDKDHIFMGYVDNGLKGPRIKSTGYYCNDPKCNWTPDNCCCDFLITENCWWLSLPKKPSVKGYE